MYNCEVCKKIFSRKSHYVYHLHRKFPCTEITQNSTDDPKSKLECKYCQKVFSRKDALIRHNTKCKNNNDKLEQLIEKITNLESEVKLLRSENKLSKKTKGNINGDHNVQNVQSIDINITPHGKEDLSSLTRSDFQKIFRRCFNSVPELVQKVHFDKSKPENHNIYISNKRDKYANVFNGEKWDEIEKDIAIDQLYDDKANLLEDKFSKLEEILDETTVNMFQKFLEKKDDDCREITKVKDELRKMLYTNREIIQATRKQMK